MSKVSEGRYMPGVLSPSTYRDFDITLKIIVEQQQKQSGTCLCNDDLLDDFRKT